MKINVWLALFMQMNTSVPPEVRFSLTPFQFQLFNALGSTLMCLLLKWAFELFMGRRLGCTPLSVMQEIALLDDDNGNSISIGCLFMDKFKFGDIKAHLLSKLEERPEFMSKLVKLHGHRWYQTMKQQEWDAKKHYLVMLKENVHTEKELCSFMAEQ